MKKRIVWITLLMILTLSFGCEAQSKKVFDEANLFSVQEEAALEEQIAGFEEQYGFEFAIVTNKSAHSQSVDVLADNLYDSGKYGVDPQKDGFLFLLDLSKSEYALSTCGKAVDYYTYDKASQFENEIIPPLSNAKYGYSSFANACGKAVSLISELMNSYYQYDVFSGQTKLIGEKAVTKTEIIVTAIISVVGGLFLSLRTISTYQLKGNTYHYELEKNSGVTLTKKEDTFLRTSHSRTRIVSSSGGSRGGGGGFSSGSRGSNVHISSGGVRHGGSHGHF